MRSIIAFVFFSFSGFSAITAQEFESVVSIDASQLTGSDREYLNGLDVLIENYINQNTRTDDPTFKVNKIRLNLQLIVETQSFNRSYTGRIFIGASRIIYQSEKESSLIRYMDGSVKFDFNQGEVLNFNERQFHSLTSLIDFYLYLILGLDADSYDPLAGNSYFLRASKIANLPGTSAFPGWNIQPNVISRKQIIDEFLDPKLQPFRQAFFKYHYDGLDIMNYNNSVAYQGLLDGLNMIQETDFLFPNSAWKRRFFEAKSKELNDNFKDAPLEIKAKVTELLKKVDPSNANDYSDLF